MSLFMALKEAGYAVKISPTPRQASVCCGVSLLVKSTEMEGVRKYMEEHAAAYEKIVELDRRNAGSVLLMPRCCLQKNASLQL